MPTPPIRATKRRATPASRSSRRPAAPATAQHPCAVARRHGPREAHPRVGNAARAQRRRAAQRNGQDFQNLTDEDLVVLLPAIEKLAPSNEMFADGIRLTGLDLLYRLHIREGMAVCVAVIEPDRWGEKNRTKDCLTCLARYGAHTKPLLPKLQEVRTHLTTVKEVSAAYLAEFDQLVAVVESSTATPSLVSLTKFKSRSARSE